MNFLKKWVDSQNQKISAENSIQAARERQEFNRLAKIAMRPEPRDANPEYFQIANARSIVRNYVHERNTLGDKARLRVFGYPEFPRFGEKK
jgi:hypothetical protein